MLTVFNWELIDTGAGYSSIEEELYSASKFSFQNMAGLVTSFAIRRVLNPNLFKWHSGCSVIASSGQLLLFLLAVFNLAGAILNPNTTIYSNSGSSLLGWPPDNGSSGTLTDNSLNGPHVKNSHNKPRPDMKFHVSE